MRRRWWHRALVAVIEEHVAQQAPSTDLVVWYYENEKAKRPNPMPTSPPHGFAIPENERMQGEARK